MTEVCISYDDQPGDVFDKINAALESHGLRFVDDGKEYEGQMVYRLEEYQSD